MLVTNFHLKYMLYRIIMAGYQLLDTGQMHPVRERAKRALLSSVDYIDSSMQDALGFETQRELLEYSLMQAPAQGHYLEFGVFSGGTIRHTAKRKPDVTIHGFDSFEGLPSAWGGFSLGAGAFSRDGKLPSVPSNVVLHKGWFSNTIPPWKQQYGGTIAFVHIDCDLYSSTVDILEGLVEHMRPGTVILFDEYFNYPGWERHEFKAWKEFVAAHDVKYEYLGYARQQVLVRIVSLGHAS
ncbi:MULTISPECIES: TylF/MycF/NovP-related O-methyltransferase [unclassified Bradyrhizobium]|uniref:TylF/MycF/NovP-related O-methyltransferase n=1 Tax=unclassified Bradyrhizobium TaxID=2631580 RepID=UPI002915D14C|nr:MULTISPECIES: TylF/MycF/NovP-related O-methyltransferase [unclassified Bradyrhizobium]